MDIAKASLDRQVSKKNFSKELFQCKLLRWILTTVPEVLEELHEHENGSGSRPKSSCFSQFTESEGISV